MSEELLETRIALVERDVDGFDKLFTKLDITIDKISTMSNDISKLLTVHDNQLSLQQSWIDRHEKDCDQYKKDNTDNFSELKKIVFELTKAFSNFPHIEVMISDQKIITDKLSDRLENLENTKLASKWFLAGVFIILGFFVNSIKTWFVEAFFK